MSLEYKPKQTKKELTSASLLFMKHASLKLK